MEETEPVPEICQELCDKVLLCHDEHKDWRKCQGILEEFRKCIEKNKSFCE
jgi:hypothetical protein